MHVWEKQDSWVFLFLLGSIPHQKKMHTHIYIYICACVFDGEKMEVYF